MIHPVDKAIQHLNNPGPGKQITQNIKKERQKENDHPLLHCVESKYFWQTNSSILIILLNPS